MEFDRIFKFYTILSVAVMLIVTVICLGFVVVKRADANLNGALLPQDLVKVTINQPVY
jgi:hypothetical protein